MTRDAVIQYWEQFDAEIDDIYDTASEEVRAVLEEQRKMVEFTIFVLRQQGVPDKDVGKWISVKDRLPDVGQRVLCIDEADTVHMATGWIDWPDKTVYFCVPDLHRWLQSSYWLPLPEVPTKRPGTKCCPNQNIEPAWKRQFMRTFLRGR